MKKQSERLNNLKKIIQDLEKTQMDDNTVIEVSELKRLYKEIRSKLYKRG